MIDQIIDSKTVKYGMDVLLMEILSDYLFKPDTTLLYVKVSMFFP